MSSSHVNVFEGTLYTEYLRIINVPLLLDQMCPAAWKLSSQMSDESKISSSLAVIIDCTLSLSPFSFLSVCAKYKFVFSLCVSFSSYNLACFISESSVTPLRVSNLSPPLFLFFYWINSERYVNNICTLLV